MRILFLTLYPDSAASPRYRVGQYLDYLRAQGFDCTVSPALTEAQFTRLAAAARNGSAARYHIAETANRLRQLFRARRYDLVFLQKGVLSAHVRGALALLRNRCQRLVYDFDDAVHLAAPNTLPGPWRSLEDPEQIRKIFGAADLVLAGNRWLENEAVSDGGRTQWLPTVIDTERFVPAASPTDAFRIGWIGGPSTTASLKLLSHVVNDVAGAEWCAVGADANRLSCPQVEVRPWAYDTEVTEIQRFSVGVMPLVKDEWTRGKCALKTLLYMSCGVPCVATPYGAVLDIIESERTGLFADSPAQWRAAFERLRDPAERRRMGEAARAAVEFRFSLKRAAPRMADLLARTAA
ncbi:MAG: glycosyltransferase family 4 protein [Candidatus Hydrogenedentales bacterium]